MKSELASQSGSMPASGRAQAPADSGTSTARVAIPAYLEQVYWWAYVHPNAVRVFEREWLVNLILFGNYSKLRDAAVRELGNGAAGATLQVACVYGDLTPRVHQCIAKDGALHVVDVLPIQLENLRKKLPADARVSLFQRDSAALGFPNASYERALVFFLLHEQPESVRRQTLAEVYRVTKPGGKIVLVDYHRPHSWNPLRRPMQALLRRLEPYAEDLWQHELTQFFPADAVFSSVSKETYFGGLYQKVVLVR
jgi:ubiquinone/menaquinone biosynthesis C-methylase UbiE